MCLSAEIYQEPIDYAPGLLVRWGAGNKSVTPVGTWKMGQKCLHGGYFRILNGIQAPLSSIFPPFPSHLFSLPPSSLPSSLPSLLPSIHSARSASILPTTLATHPHQYQAYRGPGTGGTKIRRSASPREVNSTDRPTGKQDMAMPWGRCHSGDVVHVRSFTDKGL